MTNSPVAIVTGAARGIGKAIAERLIHDGFTVAITDMDEQAAQATAAELSATHAFALGVDVTDPASAKQMVDAVVERARAAWMCW